MKAVVTHTDFRIYWPARLHVLHQFLMQRDIDFQTIEIAGRGSPYSFAPSKPKQPYYWHCLFPDRNMEEITSTVASNALTKKLDELNPDIVFAGAIAFPSGAAAVRWGMKRSRKVIIFDDAKLEDVLRSYLVNWVKRKVYSGVDAILCPAPDWQETFRYFGFSKQQLFYGLNVVDNGFWLREETSTFEKPGFDYFLTVGRQIRKKNFITLLHAYNQYANKSDKPLHLVFIGDGPENIELKRLSQEYKLEHYIHFLPFLSQNELKHYYRDAAFFVLPSFGETWGLVVNEAMASGLPVFVSNQVGCASTLIREGVNGYTFSADKVDDLAALLLKASSIDDEQHERMRQKSKEIISEWGLERFCTGVYEAIQFVSGQKKRRPDVPGRIIIILWNGRYRPV